MRSPWKEPISFGITYDPKEKALEFEMEAGDHRVFNPKEVWTAEEFDGFGERPYKS